MDFLRFFFNMLATFTEILVIKYLLICYGNQSDCNLERCYTSGALETKNNNNNNIKVLIVISLIQNTTVEEQKAGVLSMSLKLFNLVQTGVLEWQCLEIWAVLMLNQSAFCKKKLNKDSMMPSFMLVCTLYVCAQDFIA